MVTEGRREREKRELKKAILETARNIAVEDGWEAVTIRKIAQSIEYGAPAIYALFENKDAILIELVRDGFEQLALDLRQAVAQEIEPEARLMAIARSYWAFSERCPQLYKAMNGLDGVHFGMNGKPEEIKQIQFLTGETLKAALPGKDLTPEELDDMVQILRATLHGLVSLTMAGRLTGGKEHGQALMERTARDLLKAWRMNH